MLRLKLRTLILAIGAIAALGTALRLLATEYAAHTRAASEIASPKTLATYKQRVRIWVYGDSIRPRILHARPGPINVTVENKTILNADITIDRLLPNEVVAPIGFLSISADRGRGTQELLVGEGEYVLYERARPQFKAKLIVSP